MKDPFDSSRELGEALRLPEYQAYVKYVSLIAQIRTKGLKTGVFLPRIRVQNPKKTG